MELLLLLYQVILVHQSYRKLCRVTKHIESWFESSPTLPSPEIGKPTVPSLVTSPAGSAAWWIASAKPCVPASGYKHYQSSGWKSITNNDWIPSLVMVMLVLLIFFRWLLSGDGGGERFHPRCGFAPNLGSFSRLFAQLFFDILRRQPSCLLARSIQHRRFQWAHRPSRGSPPWCRRSHPRCRRGRRRVFLHSFIHNCQTLISQNNPAFLQPVGRQHHTYWLHCMSDHHVVVLLLFFKEFLFLTVIEISFISIH